MAKYEPVGSGQWTAYRKKKTDWGAVFGGIVIIGIAVAVIANL